MFKKISLALILCTFLCFTQPSINAYTTVTTTVYESPSFLEIICKINPKLGAYMAIGTIAGGIAGFIAYIIEEKEYKTERHSSY